MSHVSSSISSDIVYSAFCSMHVSFETCSQMSQNQALCNMVDFVFYTSGNSNFLIW